MGLAAAPNVEIDIGGAIPDEHFLSFTVERDLYQPDMAAITLANQGDIYSDKKLGEAVEIKVGKPPQSIFVGEITGLEPTYKGGEKTKIVIRAMNKFHRLLRKRRSMTYTDKTDKEILGQIVKESGLTLDWNHEKSITYKHVYQHNQSDMEFLRTRASRMGCHVWCVNTTLHVKQPDLSDELKQELNVDESSDNAQLRSLSVRLSTASIVKKVTVKGWNPETKELIVGEATAQRSKLGPENAVSGSGDLGSEETFNVDTPVWSKEEADALAKARLQELSLSFMTASAELTGNAAFDLAKTVKIVANGSKSDDPFNGKYYINGITHVHNPAGFTTLLRLLRDAQKGTG